MDTLPSVLFPILILSLILSTGAAFAESTDQAFGSAGNPVKTRGASGASDYINSLDCENGAIPEYRHENTTETGPFGRKLDKYVLRCAAESVEMFTIYVDTNHDETDTKPIKGFTSWL